MIALQLPSRLILIRLQTVKATDKEIVTTTTTLTATAKAVETVTTTIATGYTGVVPTSTGMAYQSLLL